MTQNAPTSPGLPESSATGETRLQSLVALLIAGPAPSLGILAGLHLWPGPVGNLFYLLGKGVLYLTPVIWWKLVTRKPYPLSWPVQGSMRQGVMLGIALAAVIVGVFWFALRPHIDPVHLHAAAEASGFGTPASYLWMALCICLVNALLEEYAFRWFLYERCRALLGKAAGALLGALIFTAHHVFVLLAYFDAPMVWLGSFGVFVGGLVWTWLYERRRSVWPAYVSHVIVDVALLSIGALLLFG